MANRRRLVRAFPKKLDKREGIYHNIYHNRLNGEDAKMNVAKVFMNGRSQAVRLPKDFRFNAKEVYINKIDNIIILIPKDNPWVNMMNSLDKFTEDFMSERNQPENKRRRLF